MDELIGICSKCGGFVVVPKEWLGMYPPNPRCIQCGAEKKRNVPIVHME